MHSILTGCVSAFLAVKIKAIINNEVNNNSLQQNFIYPCYLTYKFIRKYEHLRSVLLFSHKTIYRKFTNMKMVYYYYNQSTTLLH